MSVMFGSRRARRELQRAEEALRWARLPVVEDVTGVMLKRGEVAHAIAGGVRLVEPRRSPGTRVSYSSGSSFRTFGGGRRWSGTSRGHYRPGKEQQTVIDSGVFAVTSQRCIFIGSRRSTEWAYSKLLGYTIARNCVVVFNVSNRQKATGVQYERSQEAMIAYTVAAAIAAFSGRQEHELLLADLTADVLEARNALADRGMPVLPP
jgi:hypothetical protein